MAVQRRYPPNSILKREREERGWSLDDLAQRIRDSMAEAGQQSDLEAKTVSRWETGERRPSPRYRQHLVLIFGKPVSQLGLSDMPMAVDETKAETISSEVPWFSLRHR